ncbi:uncharacterized protein LOC132281653 [Cornus florida]|uniref:uncharacterized protein LOC132281653 n=1 Tax=Cornus florida TaxID=4283 RepID=UPI00289C3EFA|nr:uncharacterized protein LOC132281653 [Cornus florida]
MTKNCTGCRNAGLHGWDMEIRTQNSFIEKRKSDDEKMRSSDWKMLMALGEFNDGMHQHGLLLGVANGKRGDNFIPFRGLRQGDPISPISFCYLLEGLSLLFHDFERRKLLQGQLVNLNKSCLFFSPNTSSTHKSYCKSPLWILNVDWANTYLCLPLLLGQSKVAALNFISDRVSSRTKLLKGKLLSKAGREVMVKVVLLALPTYAMQCLKLPKQNCKDLFSMFLNCWWSGEEKSHKIKWISWDSICDSKANGGLGFKDIEAFNLVFLAKMAWRMEMGDDSLLFKSFKMKYFKHCNFVDAPNKPRSSWVWKSILSAQNVIKKGMKWCLGNASRINCWQDNWLPDPSNFSATSSSSHSNLSSVANFINHSSHHVTSAVDQKVWGVSHDGTFSVKSAYQVALSFLRKKPQSGVAVGCSFEAFKRAMWRQVRTIKAHRKKLLFLWQSLHDRISVNHLLFLRGCSEISECLWCLSAVETMDLLLCTYPFACLVWRLSTLRLDLCGQGPSFWPKRWVDLSEIWSSSANQVESFSLAAFICWTLWKCINDLIFRKKRWDLFDATQTAFRDYQEYWEFSRQSSLLSFPSPPLAPHSSRWNALGEGCFKLNFDASFDSSMKTCGGNFILFPLKVASAFLSNVSCLTLAKAFLFLNSGVSLGASLAWVRRGGNVVAHVLNKKALVAANGNLEQCI